MVAELISIIGKIGLYHINSMKFKVKVLNARECFGRIDYLITPIDGSGQVWVENSKVSSLEPIY